MKTRPLAFALCLLSLPAAAADLLAGTWSVTTGAGVTYTREGSLGILTVADPAPEAVALSPAAPLPLADAVGLLQLAVTPSPHVAAFAVFEDGAGEKFTYKLSGMPILKHLGEPGNPGWERLLSKSLNANPNWPLNRAPQRPLKLTALVFRELKTTKLHLTGLVARGSEATFRTPPWEVIELPDPYSQRTYLAPAGAINSYHDADWDGEPGLSLDSLLREPGDWRVGVEVRDGWQGPVVWSTVRRVVGTADDWPLVCAAPLPLHVPRAGVYEVVAKAWQPDGTLAATRYYLLDTPQANPAPAEAPGDALDLSPGRELSYHAALWGPDGATVRVLTRDAEFTTVDDETLSLPPGRHDLDLTAPPTAGDLARVTVELRDGDRVLDRESLVLGRPSPVEAPRPATKPPVANGVLGAVFHVHDVPPPGLTRRDVLARVSRGMDQQVAIGARRIELSLNWRDLEPLPGVYRFDLIDQVAELAAAHGLQLEVAVYALNFGAPYWLLPYSERTECGLRVMPQRGWQFISDPVAPELIRAREALWRALARHCGGDARVAGYLLVGFCLDHGWYDGFDFSYEYSGPTRERFRTYLRDELQLTPAALAERWGRPVENWLEIEPPVKQWQTEVQLERSWQDFCDYREWELRQQFEPLYQTIRKLDPTAHLTQYQFHNYGAQERLYPLFQKYDVSVTCGATEEEVYGRISSLYALWGLRSRGEPNPSQGTTQWDLNAGLTSTLPFGPGNTNWSAQWGACFPEPWDTEPDGEAQFRAWNRWTDGWLHNVRKIDLSAAEARWAPVLRELAHGAAGPLEAACLFSNAYARYRNRALTSPWMSGNRMSRVWAESAHLTPRWITDATPLEKYRDAKLLWVDSDNLVLDRACADRLVEYVRGGGCLALSTEVGRYTVETGQADFGLLARLTVSELAPETTAGANAVIPADSPLAGATLRLNSRRSCRAPDRADVWARSEDGAPLVWSWRVGDGQVVLFGGAVDWDHTGGLVRALCNRRGVRRWADVDDSRVRVYGLQAGATRYTVVSFYQHLHQIRGTRDYVAYAKGKEIPFDTAAARVQTLELPPGRYRVTEALRGTNLGVHTADELAAGLTVDVVTADVKVLKCEPVE